MAKQETLQENKMGTMPMGRLMANMAIPMMISMLVQACYNVVDSIFVSNISQTSDSAVTALSLAFPVQNLMIGSAVGVAVGVNALLSKSLGSGQRETADRTAGNGITLMLICVAVFMTFGLFFAKPYYAMQSEVAETVEGGAAYVGICTVFSLGIFAEVLFERMLQATGRTMYTMVTQSVGAVMNIILDPMLIFGIGPFPTMGIAGAAVATVIGQWVAAALALFFNIRFNPDVHLHIRELPLRKDVVKPILTVAVPSVVMMSIGSIMNFGMNQILQGFSETATGVFGIYFKLQSFFFMPIFALNNATISIVAFNYGARQPGRIDKALKLSCTVAFTIMMVGFCAFRFLPELLLTPFNPSEEFMTMGCAALRTISVHFPLAAFGIALGAGFQALGNGIYGTITSLCRQLLALLPAAYLLSLSGDVNLVWWSFPIAEVVSLIVTLIFFTRIYRQKILPLKNGH